MLNYIMFFIYIIKLNIIHFGFQLYIIKLNIIHFGFLLPSLIPIYLYLLNIIYFIRVNVHSISVKLLIH